MSTHELKPGDRVRIRAGYYVGSYRAGDKGTVTRMPPVAPGTAPVYHVAMDKDGLTGTTVIFAEDEIEPDV
jgi:hypothetical protein